jgi:hypothetical protein
METTPQTAPITTQAPTSGRPHLVVVSSRPVAPADSVPPQAVLVTRFWHPRDHKWSENYFESVEHALRLFLDESGWQLLQQQQLDGPHNWELIFEARRGDFAGLTTTEMLEAVGLSKEGVEKLIAEVDRKAAPE